MEEDRVEGLKAKYGPEEAGRRIARLGGPDAAKRVYDEYKSLGLDGVIGAFDELTKPSDTAPEFLTEARARGIFKIENDPYDRGGDELTWRRFFGDICSLRTNSQSWTWALEAHKKTK